jgi:hypothetical protein
MDSSLCTSDNSLSLSSQTCSADFGKKYLRQAFPTVAEFIIESYKQLQSGSTDATVLLAQI